MTEPFVKICGVRERSVLEAALEGGATAIGFNFVPSSRRRISVAAARDLVEAWQRLALRPPTWVGIFADADETTVADVRRAVGLDLVQLHGHESAAVVARCQPGYKALRVGGLADLTGLNELAGAFVLIDAYVPGQLGGTGERVPLDLLSSAARERPIVVAGGLDADNVGEVIESVGPVGVDTASGAEDEYGTPSPSAARRFAVAARAAFDRLHPEQAHV